MAIWIRDLLVYLSVGCSSVFQHTAARVAEHSYQRLAPVIQIVPRGPNSTTDGIGMRLARDVSS
jgi:hypothetical protein